MGALGYFPTYVRALTVLRRLLRSVLVADRRGCP